jgi:hypothetical protein
MKMKMFKTGLCVVAASCLFVQGALAEPKHVVSGVVTDIETGKPIEGARVADDDYGPKPSKGAITDSEGKYSYTTWGEEHNVVAKAIGYKPKQKLLTTNPLQTSKGDALNFELSPQTPYATPVSVLLEQGIYTEETVGDLGRAIEIYQQIIADDQTNQKYVNKALSRLQRCYAVSSPGSVRTGVVPSEFVGTWVGQTVDKPNEGTSTDTLTLQINIPTTNGWRASASGSLCRDGRQEITGIQLINDRITFIVNARDGQTVVWLGIDLESDRALIGESLALGEGDGRNFFMEKKQLAKPKSILDAVFPELNGCRLKYPIVLRAGLEQGAVREYTLHQSDLVELTWTFDSKNRGDADGEISVELLPAPGTGLKRVQVPGNDQNIMLSEGRIDPFVLDSAAPGKYLLRLSVAAVSGMKVVDEAVLNVKKTIYSQLGQNDIQLDTDIRFTSVQQSLNTGGTIKKHGFINSDFVHIESMYDGDGEDVEFTETHHGNHFSYRAALNKPVNQGEILFLGSRGWEEGLVQKITDNEFLYRMNHTPGGNAPTRRVEIFRLPAGAKLLSTKPADLPHRVRDDGRIEILVDTVIPMGGSLLTEFRYRLGDARDKIVVEDLALRLLVAIREKDDAVLQELSADRIEGWRESLPVFAGEAREHFRRLTGQSFGMQEEECLIQGDFAAVKCVGPDSLKGIYLVLFFENTAAGWKNITMKNSPPAKSLESHLNELLGTALRSGWETKSMAASNKYVKQIAALKKKADSKEKQEALEQIEAITAQATFHQGALVQLAQLAAEAPFNHRRIVKAAELASQLGYHTGALVEVAKIASKAKRECEELDEILELVVFKLSETPRIIQLAREAVEAGSLEEQQAIRSRITVFQESADYQTLEEALEGQKTVFDSGSTYKPLSLKPVPWTDGEFLRYRIVTKTGMEMGQQFWITRAGEREGVDCWEIEQRLTIPLQNREMFTQVQIDKEGLAPISSWSKHHLGEVHAQYQAGKVIITQGTAKPREFPRSDQVFDNDQVIHLMRCLPLYSGYRATFPIVSILNGSTPLECRVRVVKREEITVPAGTFDCWKVRLQVYSGAIKAVEQYFWYSVKEQLFVKMESDGGDIELVERGSETAESSIELEEHGAVLKLPKGWFVYERPGTGKASEILRLLPPDMKLEGMLCKTARLPATISVQEIATKDVEVLKGYFKNYSVREDSVVEKEVGGMPVYIYAADYDDNGVAKVEHRVYYAACSRVFWFVFRVPSETYASTAPELMQLVDGFEVNIGLQERVREWLRHNWRDVKDRQDIEWGEVQEHETGNRSIRYKFKARIWDGEMQVYEDTFTFDSKGAYVGVERTEGYPQPVPQL